MLRPAFSSDSVRFCCQSASSYVLKCLWGSTSWPRFPRSSHLAVSLDVLMRQLEEFWVCLVCGNAGGIVCCCCCRCSLCHPCAVASPSTFQELCFVNLGAFPCLLAPCAKQEGLVCVSVHALVSPSPSPTKPNPTSQRPPPLYI